MVWFNYILFISITLVGFFYLLTNRVFVLKDALLPEKNILVSGKQSLLLFIFATGIISCGGDLMANRLLMTIIITFSAIIICKKKIIFSPVVLFYIFYLSWLIISILFYSSVKGYGLRVFLKYLYPLLLVIFASQVTNSSKYYFKGLQIILYVGLYGACFFLLLSRIPFLGEFLYNFTFWGTAIMDFFPVVITICFALYSYINKKRYLFYILLFVLPTVLSGVRTGLLAVSITIVVFAVVRYKLKSIPYVFIGCAILIGAILYVPAIRDKMFLRQMSTEEIIEQRDELTQDDIQSNGRFAMWEWSMENLYKGKELTGSGLGALQYAFYNWDHPFGKLKVVHNDYVQILCDTGLIGLILYLAVFLSLILHSLIVYFNKKYNNIIRFAALVAGVSLAGMVSTLYTDNVVNYSLMTLSYPFALYGMMLGLKKRYSFEIKKDD